MSLENDGVWKAGVWATTVWADGVWREGEPPAPVIPPSGIIRTTTFRNRQRSISASGKTRDIKSNRS